MQEEGREARNLVAFHVAVDTPSRIARKPPRAGPPPRRSTPRPVARLRSASAGRDKRSELRARYWALLFGDLQRAVGEIYNTVEAHENLNECQEVILVLENYTRDFRALGEWFRLKWEYDNTPPPQRPQSLAWEIRKTDFVRPESRRTHSVKSSPSVSGKNSPCLSGNNTPSGKNSPNLTGKASPGSGKISPRISGHSNTTSPKANIEFFSNKIASKNTAKPEPKVAKEAHRLSDIKEKEVSHITETHDFTAKAVISARDKEVDSIKQATVEIGKAKECQNACPKMVVVKSPKRTTVAKDDIKVSNDVISTQAKATIAKLDLMENEFLAKQLTENAAKNDNKLNLDKEESIVKNQKMQGNVITADDKESTVAESPVKSEDNFADVSNESSSKSSENGERYIPKQLKLDEDDNVPLVDVIGKPKSSNKYENTKEALHKEIKETTQTEVREVKKDVKNVTEKISMRPAYSQAAAKPKPVNGLTVKLEPKNQGKFMPRSKTAVEMNSNAQRSQYRNDYRYRNPTNKCSYPFNLTTGRSSLFDTPNRSVPRRPVNRTQHMGAGDNRNTPKEVNQGRKRLPRPTSLNVNEKGDKKENTNPSLEKIKDCDEYGSSDTIVNQVDLSRIESNESLKTLVAEEFDIGNSFELLNVDKNNSEDDGWLTVKSRRLSRESKKQSKSHWGNRFHQPSATTSLPTLNMLESPKQETKEITNSTKVDRAKSEQPQNISPVKLSKTHEESKSSVSSKTHCSSKREEISKQDEPPKIQEISKVQEIFSSQQPLQIQEAFSSMQPIFQIQDMPSSSQQTLQIENMPSSSQQILQTQEMPISQEILRSSATTKSQEIPKSQECSGSKFTVEASTSKLEAKDLVMIRQKSDVTGLKTRSSRSKALRKDKVKGIPKNDGSELTKNRLHSSLESLTTGLARSQESTDDTFDFDKWKVEFKSNINFLEDDDQMPNQNEILKSADPSEMSEIAEMTSQIEENERKISWALDFQSDVDQRKLCEEEDLLNRQIMELQQVSDIDLDTETDDTETDAEILCDDAAAGPSQCTEVVSSLTASLEDQYETALAGMSWAERVDTLGALEALVARDPGRAQQLHAKLSQGIKRRGSLQDALRRLQAKQARAERQRIEYQTERARKIHQLLARVEEVKVAKNQLIEEKRLRMEKRLQKAAENRDQHLKDIVRKAHDEEEKLREIAFIKQLEAENRRHEFLDQCRSHTTRLRQMRRDRLSKLEQKAAREAAVGARRQALEEARRLHVETLVERRKERDARVEELKELKKQERDDAAREKAEGVKSRLSALAAAAELEADALRSRIRDKQDASQQRLESHLQAIREKATGPRQATTSESHDQTAKEEKEMEEEARRREQERKDREKQKAIKKKARKVKQKLLSTSKEIFLIDCSTVDITKYSDLLRGNMHPLTTRTCKVVHQIQNMLAPLMDTDNNNKPNGYDVEEINKKYNRMNGDHDKSENNNNDVDSVNEGKRRRKKNNNDKNKSSASGSVCSSVSDTSRGSVKVEKPLHMLDVNYLERILNELHRIIDKVDGSGSQHTTIYKIHIIMALGQLLDVTGEREDILAQLSTKSLLTVVIIISRLIGSCAMSATYFVSTNACVHIVKLISDQFEKDLHSDPKEMELAKQLCDCVSVALDSVLCSTRRYEDTKDMGNSDLPVLANLRARAHTLISYLCLTGCITRAEKGGEAREGIQTLLTVCADLCRPADIDVGSERASATQSLRCALGTSVCGSRAEFCMLFAQGAGLEHSGGFVRAARTAHLLRTLAELDHIIVQEAFGEGGWPLEFRAAVARLLTQHAPNDKEAPRAIALRGGVQRLDQTLSETMVLDLIVLLGFVVVNNPQIQETICDGWSAIKTLCTLPANWLVSRLHSHALLPTLVALSEHSGAAAAIASELSTGMLDEYMKSPEAQNVKLVQVIKQGRTKKGKK